MFICQFFKNVNVRDGNIISRLVYHAAVWYYNHLNGEKPVVIISNDPKVIIIDLNSNAIMLNVIFISMLTYKISLCL